MDGAKWARLFDRLERAVSTHRQEMSEDVRISADEKLYAAHDRIMRDAGPQPPPAPIPGQTDLIEQLESE